jgi:hypothetical protein
MKIYEPATSEVSPHRPRCLSRRGAAKHLFETYGFGTEKTLAKLAVLGGGPPFHKVGAKTVVYPVDPLDQWAQAKLSPLMRSTSEHKSRAA